jgi:hypothetical protein
LLQLGRSSSRPPEFETQSDALLSDLSHEIYGVQFQIMSDEDGTPVKTLAEDLSMTDQTMPRSLAYPLKVDTCNVASTISFDRNS